jgi:hypothetical protein
LVFGLNAIYYENYSKLLNTRFGKVP